jgi:hypothetical protein
LPLTNWLHHSAAGAPAPNATFFCDNSATFCYSLRVTAANYSTATNMCNSANGTLVEFDTAAGQVRVYKFAQLA